jgi:hypothetical protein
MNIIYLVKHFIILTGLQGEKSLGIVKRKTEFIWECTKRQKKTGETKDKKEEKPTSCFILKVYTSGSFRIPPQGTETNWIANEGF